METRKRKPVRIVILCVAAGYLLTVLAATVYAQTGYLDRLPAVTLGRVDQGRVPMACLHPGEGTEYLLYTVKQEDGPWGNRYVVDQVRVRSYRPVDGDAMLLLDGADLDAPVILSCTADALYPGMEVRLGGAA